MNEVDDIRTPAMDLVSDFFNSKPHRNKEWGVSLTPAGTLEGQDGQTWPLEKAKLMCMMIAYREMIGVHSQGTFTFMLIACALLMGVAISVCFELV